MAKTKVSEWSASAASNTDIGGIDISEGCAPSGINNAIRTLMSEVKDWQSGASGDDQTSNGIFTAAGTLDVTGLFKLDGSQGTAGQVLVSAGAGNTPVWGNAFIAGMVMMWAGTIATIPTGWLLCDGANGTPDLRNRFVIGAYQDSSGVAYTTITGSNTQTGGSKDAVVVSHTHTASVTDAGHQHALAQGTGQNDGRTFAEPLYSTNTFYAYDTTNKTGVATTGITVANSTEGVSGTNANLTPYYALAFIMKA